MFNPPIHTLTAMIPRSGIYMVLQESYIAYHFYPHIYLLFAVLGSVVAVLVPLAMYLPACSANDFADRQAIPLL